MKYLFIAFILTCLHSYTFAQKASPSGTSIESNENSFFAKKELNGINGYEVTNPKFRLIDKNGKKITKYKYFQINNIYVEDGKTLTDYFYAVTDRGLEVILDAKNGDEIISLTNSAPNTFRYNRNNYENIPRLLTGSSIFRFGENLFDLSGKKIESKPQNEIKKERKFHKIPVGKYDKITQEGKKEFEDALYLKDNKHFFVEKNGKRGLVDVSSGQEIIPPQFDKIYFDWRNSGYHIVKNNSQEGLIDLKGNIVLETKFSSIGLCTENSKYAIADKSIIDLSTKKIILQPTKGVIGVSCKGGSTIAWHDKYEGKEGYFPLIFEETYNDYFMRKVFYMNDSGLTENGLTLEQSINQFRKSYPQEYSRLLNQEKRDSKNYKEHIKKQEIEANSTVKCKWCSKEIKKKDVVHGSSYMYCSEKCKMERRHSHNGID